MAAPEGTLFWVNISSVLLQVMRLQLETDDVKFSRILSGSEKRIFENGKII